MTDSEDSLPNILLVVWDACRYDYAFEHASFLQELASSNVKFENAVAPSPWSLPSHASIFSGRHPHEHGSCQFGESVETPVVETLSGRGYETYGVSANGFASQRTGFDESFDTFRYTGGRDRYIDGMDVSGRAQKLLRDDETSHADAFVHTLRRIPRQDHPIKSLANLATVGLGELATTSESLQRLPHPVFAPTSDYSYTPKKNTQMIKAILEGHDTEQPFFLFTNYMDTHRCYKPDSNLQEKHLGQTLSYSELVRLNEEVAAPFSFESRKAHDTLHEADVEDIRGLYVGEVETVDRHLQKIHETLEDEGLLEETVVVVTADHGENLGETDKMGRVRMGHEASVSDAVLHVPLVVAHPELEAVTIEDEFSLERLSELFTGLSDVAHPSDAIHSAIPDCAVSQYPATGGKDDTFEKYPEVPEETVRHRSSEHSAVAYGDGWRVIVESTGECWAFKNGERMALAEAPDKLVSQADDHLENLLELSADELSDSQVSQLEALGYI